MYANKVKKIAAVHDLSGMGRVSLTVVIPILSSMGFQVCYVLDQDVTLNDEETIGFSAEEKLPITCGPGRSLDQTMLQISYQPA